jgi:hypothetical protein
MALFDAFESALGCEYKGLSLPRKMPHSFTDPSTSYWIEKSAEKIKAFQERVTTGGVLSVSHE